MDNATLEQFKLLLNKNKGNVLGEEEIKNLKENIHGLLYPEYRNCKERYYNFSFHDKYDPLKLLDILIDELIKSNPNGEIINLIQDLIQDMWKKSPALAVHSVRVSYLSMYLTQEILFSEKSIVAVHGSYEEELMIQNGLAGLLHDIGKLIGRKNQSESQGRMSNMEYQLYCEHVINGHFFLKKNGIKENVLYGVLQHHEKCNGKGFPMELHGGNITNTGKILFIANQFEHHTEKYGDFTKIEPFAVIHKMLAGIMEMELSYVTKLWKSMLQNFLGEKVVLTDGNIAELYQIDAKEPTKSIVRINGDIVRLSNFNGLEIEKMAEI